MFRFYEIRKLCASEIYYEGMRATGCIAIMGFLNLDAYRSIDPSVKLEAVSFGSIVVGRVPAVKVSETSCFCQTIQRFIDVHYRLGSVYVPLPSLAAAFRRASIPSANCFRVASVRNVVVTHSNGCDSYE